MSRTTVVGAICFATLAVVLVLGTQVLGVSDTATPYVTTVLSFIGLAVGQLISTKKSENAENVVNDLNKDLRNGTFERLLREALIKVAQDQGTSLEIRNGNGREEES